MQKIKRLWAWYKRVTGYEKAVAERNGPRIQSTYPPIDNNNTK